MASENGTLELAHAIPGRVRLRWRGEDGIPEKTVDALRNAPGVRDVEYRPGSRSLLLLLDRGISAEDVRAAARQAGVDVADPPGPPPIVKPKPEPEPVFGRSDALIKDLEAVLLLFVMLSWIRDLVVNRVFRTSTILLLILTAIDLYRYWLRRQRSMQAESPFPAQDQTGQIDLKDSLAGAMESLAA